MDMDAQMQMHHQQQDASGTDMIALQKVGAAATATAARRARPDDRTAIPAPPHRCPSAPPTPTHPSVLMSLRVCASACSRPLPSAALRARDPSLLSGQLHVRHEGAAEGEGSQCEDEDGENGEGRSDSEARTRTQGDRSAHTEDSDTRLTLSRLSAVLSAVFARLRIITVTVFVAVSMQCCSCTITVIRTFCCCKWEAHSSNCQTTHGRTPLRSHADAPRLCSCRPPRRCSVCFTGTQMCAFRTHADSHPDCCVLSSLVLVVQSGRPSAAGRG